MLTAIERANRSAHDALAPTYAARVSDRGPVIDIGCGTGLLAAHLIARGLALVGSDVSEGMVAMARASHPGLPLLVASNLLAFQSGDGERVDREQC